MGCVCSLRADHVNLSSTFERRAREHQQQQQQRRNGNERASVASDLDACVAERKTTLAVDEAVSAKLDTYLNELNGLVVRDFIMPWLANLTWEREKIATFAKQELSELVESLKRRLRLKHVDYVKLFSKNLVLIFHRHFANFRRSSTLNERFEANTYEKSDELRKDHVRTLLEVFLLNAYGTSPAYFDNSPIRWLVRELMLNKLVMPSIELLSDPDYINQRLVDYLTRRESERSLRTRKFALAATFEDFVRLIKSAKSAHELRQLYAHTMYEIAHATIISELQNERAAVAGGGLASILKPSVSTTHLAQATTTTATTLAANDSTSTPALNVLEPSTSSTLKGAAAVTKAELLKQRNLKQYLKQLRYAQSLCENRLASASASPGTLTSQASLVLSDGEECDETWRPATTTTKLADPERRVIYATRLTPPVGPSTSATAQQQQQQQQHTLPPVLGHLSILPFESVLTSTEARTHFLSMLERVGSDALLRFWSDVEKLRAVKTSHMKRKYEMGARIYANYMTHYDSPVREECGKELHRAMQLFLVGNSTEECFYKAQARIEHVLKRDHYPNFLVTDAYANLELHRQLPLSPGRSNNNETSSTHSNNETNAESEALPLRRVNSESDSMTAASNTQAEPSQIVDTNKRKLDKLRERLRMKTSALNVIKVKGFKSDDSKLVEILTKDIATLKQDIAKYEVYLEKSEMWCENMGNWKTKVVNATLSHSYSKSKSNSSNNNSTNSNNNNFHDHSSFSSNATISTISDATLTSTTSTTSTTTTTINSSSSSSNSVLYEIHVVLGNAETSDGIELTSLKHHKMDGWIIYRSMAQFCALHRALIDVMPPAIKSKFKRIPNLRANRLISLNSSHQGSNINVNSSSSSYAKQVKSVIGFVDDYLRSLVEHESLAQSEPLYSFLCPNPQQFDTSGRLDDNTTSQSVKQKRKRTKSPLSESDVLSTGGGGDYLDLLLFVDDEASRLLLSSNGVENDSIAEHIYQLLDDVFELRGMKMLFRKSLVLLVQMRYGATINRKIRECICWMLGDEQIAYYLGQLRDSFWRCAGDERELREWQSRQRSNEEKLQTKKEANRKLIENIPDELIRLVGEKNAQMGVSKLFDIFQDKKLNKHLIHQLLDMFVDELFSSDSEQKNDAKRTSDANPTPTPTPTTTSPSTVQTTSVHYADSSTIHARSLQDISPAFYLSFI